MQFHAPSGILEQGFVHYHASGQQSVVQALYTEALHYLIQIALPHYPNTTTLKCIVQGDKYQLIFW